ncbi:MAG: YqaE/Pmp3 family membrane protein [Crocinitomicaceae bacterium]|nr:YqaE/Pmp3 family membrane protein [Crocinitomicaceae bacterium]
MKKISVFSLLMITTLILGSCGSSNNVVSNKLISKRKYNKGFFVNRKSVNVASSKTVEKETKSGIIISERNSEKLVTAKLDIATSGVSNSNQLSLPDSRGTVVTKNETLITVSPEASFIDYSQDSDNELVEKNSLVSEKELEVELNNLVVERIKRNKERQNQKENDSSSDDSMFILAVILAILIPPLGVLVYTNIDWEKVLICLILTILFFLPGMIYALLVVFDMI